MFAADDDEESDEATVAKVADDSTLPVTVVVIMLRVLICMHRQLRAAVLSTTRTQHRQRGSQLAVLSSQIKGFSLDDAQHLFSRGANANCEPPGR